MKKKGTTPAVATSPVSNPLAGWGGETVQVRVPSGVKLRLTPDCDMIVKFLGDRDITDNLKAEDRARNEAVGKRAIMHAFHDGRRYVSLAATYATSTAKLEVGNWYYIHFDSEIDMGIGRAAMKDLNILKIGPDGTEVQVPERVHPKRTLTVNSENCAEANYTRLNYPLRTK